MRCASTFAVAGRSRCAFDSAAFTYCNVWNISTFQSKNRSISADPRLVMERTCCSPGTLFTASSRGRVTVTIIWSIFSVGLPPGRLVDDAAGAAAGGAGASLPGRPDARRDCGHVGCAAGHGEEPLAAWTEAAASQGGEPFEGVCPSEGAGKWTLNPWTTLNETALSKSCGRHSNAALRR